MIIETLTVLTNALNHSTYGVAAQYASIPTGSIAINVVPPVAIVSMFSEAELASDTYTGEFPALLVTQTEDVLLVQRNASGARDATEYTATITYLGKEFPQDDALRSALLTMRAVQRSLEALFSNENAADRVLNGVQLWTYTTMTQGPVQNNPNDKVQDCAFKIVMQVRDTVL
jgi:hypothetical protein